MKLQDVILKAMAKRLNGIEAAEIAGMSVRHMQRLRQRYQESGYRGLSITCGGGHTAAGHACWWGPRLPT